MLGVGELSELLEFFASLGSFRANFYKELEAIRVETEQIKDRIVQLRKIVFLLLLLFIIIYF